jgi:hypothetical protein
MVNHIVVELTGLGLTMLDNSEVHENGI